MWPQAVLAAAAQIRRHRGRACAGAWQISPGYPCARCGDGVGRHPVRGRADPACGMGGALPGLLMGLVGDEVPSGAVRSQTERVLRGQGAIAVLAARMVTACRGAGSPAILTAATEALWSYTIPLRRARAALLVGDVMVLGAPLSGGSAALTPGLALLPGLSV